MNTTKEDLKALKELAKAYNDKEYPPEMDMSGFDKCMENLFDIAKN